MSGKDKDTKLSRRALTDRLMGSAGENLKTVFGGDYRSYALFRIAIALVTILDLINRSSDLYAHYSDSGLMPRQLVLNFFHNDLWITVHMMSGLWWVQLIIFLVHGVITFSMLIGYRTKLSTFLSWFLLVSLHNRNLLVLHGGDGLQRIVMFYALFLPIGECYSIDSAFYSKKHRLGARARRPDQYRFVNVATFTLSIQIGAMYVASYWHKTGVEWTTTRTATWLALQLDYFRTPVGDFFLLFPGLLKLLTAAVLWWEGYGVLFWYAPVFSGPSRLFGVLGFWFMHLGFGLCLRLGQFGCCGMAAVVGLLPTFFWEDLIFRKLRTKERMNFKYYYNPYNSFSTNLAIIASNFLLIPETQVIAMDDDELRGKRKSESDDEPLSYKKDDNIVVDIKPARTFTPMSTSNVWIMVQDYRGVHHSNIEAVYHVCKVSPLLWPLTYLFQFKFTGKWVKGSLAIIPAYFNTQQRNINPQPSVSSARPPLQKILRQFWLLFSTIVSNLFVFSMLLLCVSWNLGNLGWYQYGPPPNVKWVAWFLHLDQHWAMFSPRPPNVQWYYVIEGELDNGSAVDLWRNEGMFTWEPSTPVEWERPQPFHKSVKNHRWFKYYENGVNSHPKNDELRLHWGRYICREFNSRHFGADKLYKFSIHWMSERADPDVPRVMNQKFTMWNHLCYEKK